MWRLFLDLSQLCWVLCIVCSKTKHAVQSKCKPIFRKVLSSAGRIGCLPEQWSDIGCAEDWRGSNTSNVPSRFWMNRRVMSNVLCVHDSQQSHSSPEHLSCLIKAKTKLNVVNKRSKQQATVIWQWPLDNNNNNVTFHCMHMHLPYAN